MRLKVLYIILILFLTSCKKDEKVVAPEDFEKELDKPIYDFSAELFINKTIIENDFLGMYSKNNGNEVKVSIYNYGDRDTTLKCLNVFFDKQLLKYTDYDTLNKVNRDIYYHKNVFDFKDNSLVLENCKGQNIVFRVPNINLNFINNFKDIDTIFKSKGFEAKIDYEFNFNINTSIFNHEYYFTKEIFGIDSAENTNKFDDITLDDDGYLRLTPEKLKNLTANRYYCINFMDITNDLKSSNNSIINITHFLRYVKIVYLAE